MGKLQVLPANIANMIAAGEVVQRPASVIKELMENAVDAGATQIDVIIGDAGRTLIQVIDNGYGMSPEDAVLCFERHATSKIASAEDLESILTYGFRGEALASIAAVSEVTLKTRRSCDEVATQVKVGADTLMTSETSGPVGSNFSIRNLFYNIPARRKFLKSDNVELKHIVEEFTHVALTRPEISFSLTHNGREMFVLKHAQSVKFRIMDLLGTSVTGDVVDINAESSIASIHGYIGRPESAKKTLGNQFLFVNGRFFRSPYLHKAIMNAYEEMMPEGLTPSYFIYIDIDPSSIDVNISPTKTEIKFEEDSVMFQILYASVRETLGRNAFGSGIDFEAESSIVLPQSTRSYEEYKGGQLSPAADVDTSYNPFDSFPAMDSFDFEKESLSPGASSYDYAANINKSQNYGVLFEDKVLPSTQAIVIGGKYIATPSASGLMLVNIRRAIERIEYEKALKVLSSDGHTTQTALFPVEVIVGVAQRLTLDDNADLLQSLGFDIAPFGNDSVVVNGVPEGYSCEEGKVRSMVADLLDILSESHKTLPEVMRSTMAEKFANLASANMSAPRTAFEAQKILDTLFASDCAEFTSTGKRIISVVPVADIEKRF